MLHHLSGCVHDENGKMCWTDGDKVEWHRGLVTGVYRVRSIVPPSPPPKLVSDFIRGDNIHENHGGIIGHS